MTPEAKARLEIDRKLEQAGWVVQDLKKINLGTGPGVVVREYPTDTGPADYLLFVDRQPVGVIEAKPDNTILTFVEDQTERYARSILKWRVPIKDDSLDNLDELPAPDVLAQEIIDHLEAALNSFRDVAAGLAVK